MLHTTFYYHTDRGLETTDILKNGVLMKVYRHSIPLYGIGLVVDFPCKTDDKRKNTLNNTLWELEKKNIRWIEIEKDFKDYKEVFKSIAQRMIYRSRLNKWLFYRMLKTKNRTYLPLIENLDDECKTYLLSVGDPGDPCKGLKCSFNCCLALNMGLRIPLCHTAKGWDRKRKSFFNNRISSSI